MSKPEHLLNQIEAVYQKLETEGVEAPGNRELSAGVIVLMSAIVAQQDAIDKLVEKNGILETQLDAMFEKVNQLEHTLTFDYVTSSNLDDVREEIVGEASLRAKDELEWELMDKVDEYTVNELQSRVSELESQVSNLESIAESNED